MNLVADIEFSALILIQIAMILFLIFYLIFAAIVIKQVKVMTETLQIGFENPIKALAFFHFVFAFIVLFLAIIVL